jgi:hypothetical protein
VKPKESIAKSACIAQTGLFVLLDALLQANPGNTFQTDKASGLNQLLRTAARRMPAWGLTTMCGLIVGGLCVEALLLPAPVNAFATSAPPPSYSTAPGLPDGRVYEQVSPIDKDGNQAGAGTNETLSYGGLNHYALAAPSGNAFLYEGSGPFGETAAGYNLFYVAERTAAGWSTRSILPRAQTPTTGGTITVQPTRVDPSADLSHVVFKAGGLFSASPYPKCGNESGENLNQLDLSGPDPFAPATWLERPQISNPIENCASGFGFSSGAPIGGTPNFSTFYFTYPGTLLPEDTSRAPHAEGEIHGKQSVEAWGLYEYTDGSLKEAGVLPDGSLDPFGAVPAASLHGHAVVGNQVSADGTRLFFVSPDPDSCDYENNCKADPPELYVRENGERTLLVSRNLLAPEIGDSPSAAPLGVAEMPNPFFGEGSGEPEPTGSDVFASSDGTHVFFQSDSDLTKPAEEVSPNPVPKMYDFDVETSALTYLPNVSGRIVAASQNGSSVAFVDSTVSPAQLDLWSEGPAGGTVTPIVQLPGDGRVGPTRMSRDGSTVVFQTSALIGGFNNGGTHQVDGQPIPGTEQIYRYEAASNTVGCVSCPPAGTAPTSNAEISPRYATEVGGDANDEEGLATEAGWVEEDGVSADGSRVFFDTADPLVPQDSNTGSLTVYKGTNAPAIKQEGRDVYEWENGTVYLISSGKSSRNSFFLDSSESGGDVFFATEEGLVRGDTDGAYDVYDARVPHPGDTQPPVAVACEGPVCQGPSQVPAPFGVPASATFSGPGNATSVISTPAVKAKPKIATASQKLSVALKSCRKRPKNKRTKCEAEVKKEYMLEVKRANRRDK